jgi:glycine hydroxymethyltransferase
VTLPPATSAKPDIHEQLQSIRRLTDANTRIKRYGLSLVPTENILSPLATDVLASDLVNRYFTVDGDCDLEYPRAEHLQAIESIAESALMDLFHIGHVNVRPISGLTGMLVAAASLTTPGSVVYTLSPSDGGHASTANIITRLGAKVLHLPFSTADLSIDVDECAAQFKRVAPGLVYIDHTNVLFPLDTQGLRQVAPPGTAIHYDCSQLLGLMVDSDYFDPVAQGASSIGASTHKTFPGPQKAVLMTDDENSAQRFREVANVFISNHHMNSVAALAVTALEMRLYGCDYSRMVRANALTLGKQLQAEDVPVCSARGVVSGSHQLWIEAAPADRSVSAAIRRLGEASIVVNHSRVPSLKGHKGIRMGTTGVTRLGMGREQMVEIAALVADVMLKRRRAVVVERDVQELVSSFRAPRYCVERFTTLAG